MSILISFVGGLGMFIYGMHIMASGLQKTAGSRMKRLLEALTSNKFLGILVGLFVTAIIQSSSATTVMVVGFVNAGLMNLAQAVGVIMGANIGTTVTSWIVSSVEWAKFLNPTAFAPIAIGLGASLTLFSKKDKQKQIGEIIVGFGILFFGMSVMTQAVHPLRSSEVFKKAFLTLGANPFLGILAGALVTSVVQSSSASVGILQSLAASGLVPWSAAVYIIMGQNIGTCVTALISSIGASRNARAAAYVHLLFNVLGSIIFSVLAVLYFSIFNSALGNTLISLTEISIVHTFFNVSNTLILFGASNFLVTTAQKMAHVSKSQADEGEVIHLDDRILETPSFAIQNCKKELLRLGDLALENLKLSVETLFDQDEDMISKVFARERNIDALEQAITNYLVKLCNKDISQEENDFITSLFHTVIDTERIGDHSENLAELSQLLKSDNVSFSESAQDELREIAALVIKCYSSSLDSFRDNDSKLARTVIDLEVKVDDLEERLRSAHINRLTNNECDSAAGIIFLDALTNLERVSDHALNIAQMVLHEKPQKQFQSIQ